MERVVLQWAAARAVCCPHDDASRSGHSQHRRGWQDAGVSYGAAQRGWLKLSGAVEMMKRLGNSGLRPSPSCPEAELGATYQRSVAIATVVGAKTLVGMRLLGRGGGKLELCGRSGDGEDGDAGDGDDVSTGECGCSCCPCRLGPCFLASRAPTRGPSFRLARRPGTFFARLLGDAKPQLQLSKSSCQRAFQKGDLRKGTLLLTKSLDSAQQPITAKMSEQSAAWPLADAALSQEILDLVQQCSHYR